MKLKHIFKDILGKITGYYNYGKNNKIIIIKKEKPKKCIFMPRGLKIRLRGNNNEIRLELPLKFENAKIDSRGDYNFVNIKTTNVRIKNVYITCSQGSKVIIGENASIGQGDFYLVANGNHNNGHKVVIGKNARIGKDTIIRTSDGHTLVDPETNLATNEPQDVIIGDNVWIMSRCMIAKGAKIPNNSAVAAYSFVNKPFDEENIMLAGIPAKILKHNIKWDIRPYGQYMKYFEKEVKKAGR